MNKYPKYKISGIEWIGDIPAHWDLATVGRLNNTGRGRVISAIEIGENVGDYPVYSSQTENDGIMGYLNTYDFEGEYVTWTTDGANAGTVFHREGQFNCTNVCGTIQPKNWEQIDLKFLPYFLNLGTKFSVRLDINPKLMNNMMGKIPLVIPPKPEQTAIANYLDEKIIQIDKLIANKQKLIKHLKEERTAIINQAVTKGINPNSKLKNSGINWLGDIPKHWEVKKLKLITHRIGDGIHATPDYTDYQEYFFVNGTNLNEGKIEIEDNTRSVNEDEFRKYNLGLKVGTLLLSINGTIGKSAIYRGEKIILGKSAAYIECNEELLHTYLFYLLKAEYIEYYFENSLSGTTIRNLSLFTLRNTKIILPDYKEQIAIVDYIETRLDKFDITFKKVQKEIALLQEYRTALISEVVTGKIKVI